MFLRHFRRTAAFVFIYCCLLCITPYVAFAVPPNDESNIAAYGEVPANEQQDLPQYPTGEDPFPVPSNPTETNPYTTWYPTSQVVIRLQFIKADQAKTMLTTLMPGDRIRVEAMNNTLVALGDDDACEQVKSILAQLDVPPRQVMFEAEVVEISRADLKNVGIDWGQLTTLPGSPNADDAKDGQAFRIGLGNSKYGINVSAKINRLLENKKGRLLANPRIAALDGQTAQIQIGDKLAVESTQVVSGSTLTSVTYVDVGIKLEVTPNVHDDGTITTHIKPEVSNKTDTTKNGNPNIRTRQAETTLRVKNSETIILGGLIQREENSDVFKVPILGNIPLVGQLFRSTSKEKRETELIILITPKIIDS